ncbi:hypothetical protein NMY22_g13850 [Coprinellus aureogranulatus]|nr:hypothetical protein NMY22_g13850 [Coprinellus aureogranulatus]
MFASIPDSASCEDMLRHSNPKATTALPNQISPHLVPLPIRADRLSSPSTVSLTKMKGSASRSPSRMYPSRTLPSTAPSHFTFEYSPEAYFYRHEQTLIPSHFQQGTTSQTVTHTRGPDHPSQESFVPRLLPSNPIIIAFRSPALRRHGHPDTQIHHLSHTPADVWVPTPRLLPHTPSSYLRSPVSPSILLNRRQEHNQAQPGTIDLALVVSSMGPWSEQPPGREVRFELGTKDDCERSVGGVRAFELRMFGWEYKVSRTKSFEEVVLHLPRIGTINRASIDFCPTLPNILTASLSLQRRAIRYTPFRVLAHLYFNFIALKPRLLIPASPLEFCASARALTNAEYIFRTLRSLRIVSPRNTYTNDRSPSPVKFARTRCCDHVDGRRGGPPTVTKSELKGRGAV